MNCIVTELYIYPIKSLAGIRVETAKAEEMGFENDRRWMLIDENNEFITQRENRILSQFYPEIKEGKICISFKDQNHEFSMNENFEEAIYSKVWDDETIVFEVNKTTSEWFSERLGFRCKLVKILKNGHRKHASSKLDKILNVSFADGYPFLLIGTESLNHLNEKLAKKIEINRFRPNIVVRTSMAHEEDDFTTFQIGKVSFQNVKPSGRCIMINTDPTTGNLMKEPLRTLSKYRTVDNLVYFGTNIFCLNEGDISVGDTMNF